MDYNIHIHLPDANGQKSDNVQETPQNKYVAWNKQFINRVKQCYNWRSLYQLREEFSKIGLTIKETSGGRNVLCRMENGLPIINSIIDDYIFVGSENNIDDEVNQRAMDVIINFVESNCNEPQHIVTDGQKYSHDVALYGKPLQIYKEDIQLRQQEIETISRLLIE